MDRRWKTRARRRSGGGAGFRQRVYGPGGGLHRSAGREDGSFRYGGVDGNHGGVE